jgi:hypothetical protein
LARATCLNVRIAKAQHKSMGDIVTALVDRYEEEQFWQEAKEQLARLKADPVAWQDYMDAMSNEVLEAEPPYDNPEVGTNGTDARSTRR